jgi:hypothetical protein
LDVARDGSGDFRPATAVERTLAEGLAPSPKPAKPLTERVASASEQAAKEGEAPVAKAESKAFFPA